MTEYRRILLDGYPVAVERQDDELVARDGRRVPVAEAVHLAPCEPTKIICVHLNYSSRVDEFMTRLPPAPHLFPQADHRSQHPSRRMCGAARAVPLAEL